MTTTRRNFLYGTVAFTFLAAGHRTLAQSQPNVMRFVPAGNLSSIDPIVTSGYPIRNHGYLVYDTLFAEDENFEIHPQMVDKAEESNGGLLYTLTLRPGLKFHDGAPVRAQDCIASIKRWGAKDGLGQSLLEATERLEAVDDNTIRFTLKSTFPLIYTALGKSSTPVCFIMPERVAGATDSKTQIKDATGSGPYRFLPNEWVPGSKAAYEKFKDYVPRKEAPSGIAGGKQANFDRVEWVIIPDQSTAVAALKRGEIDWFEKPDLNLVELLRGDPRIVVDNYDPYQGTFLRFNQQQKPFNNVKIRQAVMASIKQDDVLAAMVGEGNYQVCKSFFFCGTPMASGSGSEVMKGDPALGKAMLKEAGYNGEKVVLISATDIPWIHSASLVVEQLLREIGMTVEVQTMDLGTYFTRRNSTEPVEKGGWSALVSGAGSVDFLSPAQHLALRGNGLAGWPGWPDDPELERLRAEWMKTGSQAERKKIASDVEAHAFQSVPYVPLGQRSQITAYRKNISGIVKSPAPLFWNVKKNA
ncbi:ABC transporter substrate-binding protein [Rhizobium sp. CNPSo 3968]|uniref:ABC transporter substrate-binding protein n=1 Tax=Rhizobium sp. CNPSo 3968 TaxID=3021408 RepID=UPI00254F7B46|nr:ABC transporter substrate-binding protein [Rhizobium sp. CNPSo 3968]MDK4717897.1 ABC transporter substrate-binding protein [Rhizobium sp. CNPSo 3968]